MPLPDDLRAQVRSLDEYELRQLLILVRGRLGHVDGLPARDELPGVSYRQEEVRCGRSECSACPHGPYWYAYWREDGRTRSMYIGRQLPGEPLEPVVPEAPPDASAGGRDEAPAPTLLRTEHEGPT